MSSGRSPAGGETPVKVIPGEGKKERAVFFRTRDFFVLMFEDGSVEYGTKHPWYYDYHAKDTHFEESSFLTEGKKSYSVGNMGISFFRGKVSRWGSPWCEGAVGYGIGEWLSFSLTNNTASSRPFTTHKIFVSIGYVDPDRPYLYGQNSRPKTVSVFVNGTYCGDVHFEDSADYQELVTDRELAAGDTIKMVIKEVYPGTKYQDTCINDIYLLPLPAGTE